VGARRGREADGAGRSAKHKRCAAPMNFFLINTSAPSWMPCSVLWRSEHAHCWTEGSTALFLCGVADLVGRVGLVRCGESLGASRGEVGDVLRLCVDKISRVAERGMLCRKKRKKEAAASPGSRDHKRRRESKSAGKRSREKKRSKHGSPCASL